jgi:hypothetical protein
MSLRNSILSHSIAGRLVVLLALSAAVPSHAQRAVVVLELPAARRHEMTESLQIALSSRVDVELAAPSTQSLHEYVLSVEFPSGQVAPGELVLRRRDAVPAFRARLTHAWDVVDPRAVGAVALNLVESSMTEPESSVAESVASRAELDPAGVDEPERTAPATAEPLPEASADPSPEEATENAAPALEATPAPEPRGDSPDAVDAVDAVDAANDLADDSERRLSCGLCSDFVLQAGLSFTYGPASTRGVRGELAFYARLNGWASVGLRFSGGGGYSSVEGGLVDGVIGAPSVMVSHRIPLRRPSFGVELGVHAEAAIGLSFTERNREDDAVAFGLGVGAFAAFELGRSHGIAIDYTFSTFGMGGRSVRNQGALSLLYTRRWGAR